MTGEPLGVNQARAEERVLFQEARGNSMCKGMEVRGGGRFQEIRLIISTGSWVMDGNREGRGGEQGRDQLVKDVMCRAEALPRA